MLRYIRKLESRDLSLTPLDDPARLLHDEAERDSAEMLPGDLARHLTRMHPFAPTDQARGFQMMFKELEAWLAEITGMAAVSLQPNAGSQGEYAGLLAIRAYHHARGRGRPPHLLDPGLGPRDESRQRGHGRHEGRARRMRCRAATST